MQKQITQQFVQTNLYVLDLNKRVYSNVKELVVHAQ